VRKLLVFQHAASEPLGVLDPMLRRRGFRVRYVNFGRDPQATVEVGRYNGLVVLGGPMNVDQATAYPHLLAEIEASVVSGALTIPKEALRRDANGFGALTLAGDAVHWRAVKTGASSISRVQILEGAAEGDAVALPTDFTLHDGDKVSAVYP